MDITAINNRRLELSEKDNRTKKEEQELELLERCAKHYLFSVMDDSQPQVKSAADRLQQILSLIMRKRHV